MFFLPGPPDLQPRRVVTVRATYRVDSIGRYGAPTMVVEGSTNQTYFKRVAGLLMQAKFRPAVLLPDVCSVSGSSLMTFITR